MGKADKTVAKHGEVTVGNLLPMVLILAHLAEHKLDNYGWEAIGEGVNTTSSDDNLWFYYKFGDKMPIAIKVARDTGYADNIIYSIVGPASMEERLDLAIYVLDGFGLLSLDFPVVQRG